MKFEADTELDRLLRRHARRTAMSAFPAPESAASDDGAATHGAGGAHLDADELNAYAEGALPATARARYMTHLADCDECRGLVTKLTLAANVATQPSAHATPAASRSWREWLAALFAPAVLRYAVPALALLAVVAVAFIATRERRQANLVAQSEQRQASTTKEQAQYDERKAPAGMANTAAAPATDARNANSSAIAGSPLPADTTAEPAQERQKEKAAATPDLMATQSEQKPANQPTVSDGVSGKQTDTSTEAAKVSKPQPPPAATAPAVKSPAEEDKVGEAEIARKRSDADEKNKNAGPASLAGSSSGVLDRAGSRTQGNARSMPESGGRENPARKSRPASPQGSRDEAGRDDKDENATETRSAGGRRFRRQGGAWVDTAYSSSRGVVNVRRGSEQYRALVADEPGIASIAGQLGGTVIVVWKNRAYRIY